MPITLLRATAEHADFLKLIQALDQDLIARYGKTNVHLTPCHEIQQIKQLILVYVEEKAVGCGAIRFYSPNVIEIKRMYVLPNYRGKGIASQILQALEQWAKELNATQCILETGTKQPEAIALYQKYGYQKRASYASCVDQYNCAFEKALG